MVIHLENCRSYSLCLNLHSPKIPGEAHDNDTSRFSSTCFAITFIKVSIGSTSVRADQSMEEQQILFFASIVIIRKFQKCMLIVKYVNIQTHSSHSCWLIFSLRCNRQYSVLQSLFNSKVFEFDHCDWMVIVPFTKKFYQEPVSIFKFIIFNNYELDLFKA